MKIGLEKKDCQTLAAILSKVLASTYSLYTKTQHYHWNVTGPDFYSLHLMFQSQYEELAETIDEMAERIRALGEFPHGSLALFAKESLIKDEHNKELKAPEMLKRLLADHETLICYLRESLPTAEKLEDGATADFINKRLATHEKVAWMLRSHS